MPPPSIDTAIDAILHIIVEERGLGLVFTPGGVLLRLPTTRRIAERLNVPHYYVLPLLGALFLVLGLTGWSNANAGLVLVLIALFPTGLLAALLPVVALDLARAGLRTDVPAPTVVVPLVALVTSLTVEFSRAGSTVGGCGVPGVRNRLTVRGITSIS